MVEVMIANVEKAFKNAHSAILARHNTLPKIKLLEQQWQQLYGVTIVHTESFGRKTWAALLFKDQEHFMEWFLRWS